MKKKVLVISDSYPPLNVAGAQRPYALAKYLDKSKFEVSVITWPNPITYHGINPNFNPELNNVNILRIRSKIGGDKTKILTKDVKNNQSFKAYLKKKIISLIMKSIFPDKGMFWYLDVKTYLNKNSELIKNTDIVFSTSPAFSNHKIARYIKRQNKNVKWIADFRDFNYVEHWDKKKGLKAFLHKKLEKTVIIESDYITFVTKTMQKAYKEFYPKYNHKMHSVYNGFDKSEFIDIEQKQANSKNLSFFYAGSFYKGLRSPFPLMELLDKAFKDELLTKKEVKIQIAGNIEDNIKEEMKRFESNQCVNFLGNLPRPQAIKQMSEATFLWLIVANIKAHYQTVPIKIFEYIALRKPIINFAPAVGESSQIIEGNNLGYNFDTLEFNIEEAYTTFKALISDYKNGNFKPLPVENLEAFGWERQIQLIENLL